VAAAAAAMPGARLVVLRRSFCTASGCPAVIGNVIVYQDTYGHATATYMRTLGPYLDAAIARAISR
jgi:hypothetical protein